MLQLTYSPLYSEGISTEARFPRLRYQLVREALQPAVLAGRIEIVEPRPIALQDLARAHCPDYVAAFLGGTLSPALQRRIGLRPWKPEFVPRTLLLMGGTLAALEQIAAGARYAGNLAGGTHHAHRASGGGFCVFNDIAVAARCALDRLGFRQVLVVDLDVHHGDGTASIFADEPRVTTLSLHGARNYPARKPPSDYDLALPDDTGDAEYLAALGGLLPQVFATHCPDLVIYQAGVDALAEDTLGRLGLTHAGLATRNRLVLDVAESHECPVLITMGGGYADPLTASVEAHAEVFLEAARRIARPLAG